MEAVNTDQWVFEPTALLTGLQDAPLPLAELLISVAGFGHDDDAQGVSDQLAADCAAVIAAHMTLQSGHPARVPYRLSVMPCAGYDYMVLLQGGCLPRLAIAPTPGTPGATNPNDRLPRINDGPAVASPLQPQKAKTLIGSILRADRHIRAALQPRKSVHIFKALAWSPNCLMPKLSVRFSVVCAEGDKAPVRMSGATALAVACVLLRTADLAEDQGHHDIEPWVQRATNSAGLNAAAQSHKEWLKRDQAVADLKTLGLDCLADKITFEAKSATAFVSGR